MENLKQSILRIGSEMCERMLAYSVVIARPLPDSELDCMNLLNLLTGSGTLVRKGEQAGILTAGHVIRDLREGDLVKMIILQNSSGGQTGSDDGVIPTKVSGRIIRGEGMNKGGNDPLERQLWDPDIVWIGITEEDARRIGPPGYTRGVFYNWDKRKETRDQLVGSEEGKHGGMWVCGRIHEISQKLFEMGHGYRIYVQARQVFGIGKAHGPADDWDRYDYTIDLEEPTEEGIYMGNMKGDEDESVMTLLVNDPHEWHGMSGGGIWLAHMNGEDLQRKILPHFTLVGVVYAQHGIDQSGKKRVLRGHGIRSLNRILDN